MRKSLRFSSIAIWLGIQAATLPAAASIPPSLFDDEPEEPQTYTLFFASYRDLGRGMDARAIQPVRERPGFTKDDLGQIIPAKSLVSGDSSSQVAAKIMDHSLANFMKSPAVRQSEVGKTAASIEKQMSSEASFGGSGPHSTKHVFQFQMKPTESKAEMKYTGLTNARLSYSVLESKVNFEIYENLDKVTRVGVNNSVTRGESSSMLSLAWAF